MIITEYYMTRPDGVRLEKTYSDSGVMIRNTVTGAEYAEVINPENSGRSYEETNHKIELGERPDNLDDSIQYLVQSRLIHPTSAEANPDYLNENEAEPDYFNEGV